MLTTTQCNRSDLWCKKYSRADKGHRMCQATPSLGGANKYIPVPSRHYYEKKSAAKPLSGDRIAVNDNFTMAGVISTLSSRAYIEHYKDEHPRTENATVVDNLIALGTVIVGKTKTTSFSTGRDLGGFSLSNQLPRRQLPRSFRELYRRCSRACCLRLA
jgi:hypothetical protein